jgi:hypothetical protein
VRFDPAWFYPVTGLTSAEAGGKFVFSQLIDWTQRPEPAIRFFSGTAIYETEFEWTGTTGGGSCWLDVGVVHATAKVRLNGTELGVVWCAPWQVEATRALRPGKNRLEIEVVNLWPNRLLGDGTLPEQERRTRTNISRYYRQAAKGEIPLRPSGLLGPVTLQVRDE